MTTPHLDQLPAAVSAGDVRLVFFDVDGTLLNAQGELTDATRTAIARLKQRGIRTAFATGRPPFAVTRLQDQLQLDGPHVFYTGALCRAGDALLANCTLPFAQLKPLASAALAGGFYCEAYYQDCFYTTAQNDISQEHARHLGVGPVYAPLCDWPDTPAYKLLLGARLDVQPQGLASLEAAWPEFHFAYAHLPSRPAWQFASVVSGEVDKPALFQRLLQHLGLHPTQVMALGDGGSDKAFLAAAGTGVAMGNAGADVQATANFVTRSSCQDGVAYALTRLVSEC